MEESTFRKVRKDKTSKTEATNMTNKNNVSSPSSGKDNDNSTSTNARPKLVFFWTNAEVLKWLRRHCEEYHTLYASLFLENDITGRSLLKMNDSTLERMGIKEKTHREVICTEILKLKLKSDILELKDLQKKKGEAL
ncbi:Protein aveugle like protein [Argiope bruennichi]|uniref:Protein aveugle like protein n=1 Tax=Argiope bruennichi TaxID=94029 RepID=A0A8T0EYT9_ARGBR|nr:Protein aveugle like protein [Argiope bruennichi]